MAASEQNDTETPQAPDEASQWYDGRRADNLRQVEANLNQLSEGYSALDARWSELAAHEEQGHDELDTRKLLQVERERAQIQQQAAQISNAYATLQSERQRLASNSDPSYSEILNSSSHKAQMFLRSYKHKLENDPNALRQLMYADARAKAVGLKPDSDVYFRSLEAAVGLEANDRSLNDFEELSETSPNTYKVERKDKSRATPEQRVMARNLPGVTEDEYLKACAQPLSNAAQTVSLEPDELNFGQSKPIEVSLDETPKAAPPVKYRAPNPKSSVTLSPAELGIIENMATQTNRPLAEVRKEFAQNKIALHSGKAGHYQLYDAKLASEGHR